MTKKEIRKIASNHGMEGHYRGNDTEDIPKGWFFTPLLKNMLTTRLTRLKEKLQLAINREEYASPIESRPHILKYHNRNLAERPKTLSIINLITKLKKEITQRKEWLIKATENVEKFNKLNLTQ